MEEGAPSILVVQHGPGRGHGGGTRYFRPFLDHVAERAPDLHRRIRLHHTGQGPVSLEGTMAVVFFLGDPLRDRHPECYAEAVGIADEARARGVRVVNPPENLSHGKSEQLQAWQDAGVPTLPQHRFRDPDELRALSSTVPFPAVVRSDLYHGQRGMGLCQGADDVSRMIETGQVLYPGTVTPFIDVREGYRSRDPDSIWARLFHKKRVLVFGGVVQTHHVLFSAYPVVPDFASVLFPWSMWGPSLRRYEKFILKGSYATLRRWNQAALVERVAYSSLRLHSLGRQALAEDIAYWNSDEPHAGVMKRAADALGVEIVNIDYSTLADGSVVLWEANPYFHLRYFPSIPLRHQKDAEERFSRSYGGLEQFFLSLLGPGANDTLSRRN